MKFTWRLIFCGCCAENSFVGQSEEFKSVTSVDLLWNVPDFDRQIPLSRSYKVLEVVLEIIICKIKAVLMK